MPTTTHDPRSGRSSPKAPPAAPKAENPPSARPSGPRLRIKRVYVAHAPEDGRRVLVDRLWPRGVSKQELQDVVWLGEVAPSADLRKWFGHKPDRWAEFRTRYRAELRANTAVETLRDLIATGPVTLVYGARDEAHNQAVVLAEYLGEPPPSAKAERQ